MKHRIFGLGTYPIVQPLEGGQRRAAAFQRFYDTIGIDYIYACVYDRNSYDTHQTSQLDRPFFPCEPALWRARYTSDLEAGEFAARDPDIFASFARAILSAEPHALQLEQPFLWPLVKRLRQSDDFRKVPLIYSSHNVEAPLRAAVLQLDGATAEAARRVQARIERIERECVEASTLVVAVSHSDASAYASWGSDALVVRNGCNPPSLERRPPPGHQALDSNPYAVFVGGPYLPNIDGFASYLLHPDALFNLPPRPCVALCGGIGKALPTDSRHAPLANALARRTALFPRPDDEELNWLYAYARAAILPVRIGGGGNLKTAEALASGLPIIASRHAMRSFEDFFDAPGITIADNPVTFVKGMVAVLRDDPPSLDPTEQSRRRKLHWHHVFSESGLAERVEVLIGASSLARAASFDY